MNTDIRQDKEKYANNLTQAIWLDFVFMFFDLDVFKKKASA